MSLLYGQTPKLKSLENSNISEDYFSQQLLFFDQKTADNDVNILSIADTKNFLNADPKVVIVDYNSTRLNTFPHKIYKPFNEGFIGADELLRAYDLSDKFYHLPILLDNLKYVKIDSLENNDSLVDSIMSLCNIYFTEFTKQDKFDLLATQQPQKYREMIIDSIEQYTSSTNNYDKAYKLIAKVSEYIDPDKTVDLIYELLKKYNSEKKLLQPLYSQNLKDPIEQFLLFGSPETKKRTKEILIDHLKLFSTEPEGTWYHIFDEEYELSDFFDEAYLFIDYLAEIGLDVSSSSYHKIRNNLLQFRSITGQATKLLVLLTLDNVIDRNRQYSRNIYTDLDILEIYLVAGGLTEEYQIRQVPTQQKGISELIVLNESIGYKTLYGFGKGNYRIHKSIQFLLNTMLRNDGKSRRYIAMSTNRGDRFIMFAKPGQAKLLSEKYGFYLVDEF